MKKISTHTDLPLCLSLSSLAPFRKSMVGYIVFLLFIEGLFPYNVLRAQDLNTNYYFPIARNVTMFTKKAEFNLSLAGSLNKSSEAIDIQTALAITDHAGIIVNYSYFSESPPVNIYSSTLPDPPERFHGNIFDLGMGYYLALAGKFVLEAYAGYGYASYINNYTWHNQYTNPKGHGYVRSKLHASSFFLQPSLGIHWKYMELAFSTRFRLVKYRTIYSSHTENYKHGYFFTDLENNPVKCFLEPAFTGRFGGKYVKFQFQVGYSDLLGKNTSFSYDPWNLTLGVILSVGGNNKQKSPANQ